MRVARYYSRDEIRLEQMAIPDIGPGEMLVQVKACGLCGSDLMEWYADSKAPTVLGHEPVGLVSRLGEDVKGFALGDRVFVHHHVPCFICHYCLRGNYSSCRTFGESRIYPGGFAEYIRVPAINVERDVLHLPEGLDFNEATLIEPTACAIRGMDRAGLQKGDTVLIVGVGVSGLLFTQLSRLWGAGLVIASDPVEYRLQAARELGADLTINPRTDDLGAKVGEFNDGRSADLVIVTVGSASVMEEGLGLVGKGGTVLLYAPLAPGATLPVKVHDLLFSEITLVSTYSCGPDDTRAALEFISRERVQTRALVTHQFGLKQVGKAIRLAVQADESLKIVIVP